LLSLRAGLACMAVTSALAALIQAYQLGVSPYGPYDLKRTAVEYWSVGGWWSLGNGLLRDLRFQFFIWALAVTSGPAATASLQAALNVLNVANPVLIGLCNVIPQTAARSLVGRNHYGAWTAACVYILLGIPPLVCFYAVVALAPDIVLHVLYPSGSPYLHLAFAVQLLVCAFVLSYGTEMFCSFLHGVAAPHLALLINAVGAVSAVALALPLIAALGLTGGCLALIGSNAMRLAVSCYLLRRVTALTPPQRA
jgi:O-antigen/teichoic acid export membrane protein